MPDKGHEAADRDLKELEAELKTLYKEASEDMLKKAQDFMAEFEEKDERMRQKVEDGKWTLQEYINWRRNQMLTEKRIQEMTKTLAKDLANADQIAAAMIDKTLPKAYAENFNFGTYEIETGSGINTSFTLYSKETVENLLKEDPKIIPQLTEKQKKKIPEDERWNRQKLTSAITQGILQGESIPKIADRLQSVADMDRSAAIRNARTYTTAAENRGRVDSIARANDLGIPAEQEWIATLDERTRMEHRHLDGQVRPVGEPFEADGQKILYPGDITAEPFMFYNCRCTLVSKVKGRIYNDERNDEKLNGMTYEEWKHAKDRQIKPEEPKIQKEYQNRQTVSEQFEQLKTNERQGWLEDKLDMSQEEAGKTMKALDEYTIGNYGAIHNEEPEMENTIKAIDDMLHNPAMPVYDGTIYRGIHVWDSDELTADEKVQAIISGGTWNEPGITSFSSDRGDAQNFAKGGYHADGVCVLIECNNNISGCPIANLSLEPENEVLIPSDIKDRGYKIISTREETTEKTRSVRQWNESHTRIIKTTEKYTEKWIYIEVEENGQRQK